MRLEHLTRRGGGGRPAPLVFVHGAWHGAWCWDEHLMGWFAERGYDCHAVSLRGHGSSDNDRSLRATRLDHYVADLASVVDGLDAAPVLVGHSMGGLVVQRYLEGRDLPGAVLMAPVPVLVSSALVRIASAAAMSRGSVINTSMLAAPPRVGRSR